MYETVVGLEIHVQLATRSKAFCADNAQFGAAPNTQVSPISLAHPGTLPRLNKQAIEYAVRLGLALGCQITRRTTFDRKNYFYADLPKGFQTTQDRAPICVGGTVQLPHKQIRIHHIHLEEDAGKSMHDQDPRESVIDLNRAGVPLLEIVSEPDLRGPDEVAAYMEEIRRLVRWLGISDGNMEEGSMRCDVNVSVRKQGESRYGNRCEIKNVNSMRFARKAVEYEAQRQIALLESGQSVDQETRGFDANVGKTYGLREKEAAHDYRYFPEPDLPPVVLTEAYISSVKGQMPVLPQALEIQFQEVFGLSAQDAALLTQERETTEYFLATCEQVPAPPYRAIANLLIHKLLPWTKENGKALSACPVPVSAWPVYVQLIESGQISASIANQRLFPALIAEPNANPAELATSLNLLQSNDQDFLATLVDQVLAKYPEKVQEYKKGKKGLIGFFMGEVMKAAGGRAEPQATTKLLQEKLA